MNKSIIMYVITMLMITFGSKELKSEHLFYINQNDLSQQKVTQVKRQVANKNISEVSLMRNKENKEIYSVSLSSVQNTKIIILNEQTGKNVVITPVKWRNIYSKVGNTKINITN